MCLWIDRKGGKYLLNHFVPVFSCGKAMLRGRAHQKAGCVIQRELSA